MKVLNLKCAKSMLAVFFSLFLFNTNSQVITTVAGNGSNGFSGDGGLATLATVMEPEGICFDKLGNMYIAANASVRKVDVNGNISTVAGTGQPNFYYTGDGGRATSTNLYYPNSVLVDDAGNIYISDLGYYRILKVTTDGIIHTIAGNGTYSFSGDGGLAINATIKEVSGMAFDKSGNFCFADGGNGRIRMINSSGIISTIAGNGTSDYYGDGKLAINSGLGYMSSLAFDTAGNLYVATNVIRKIDTKGIVTTIAGNGNGGFSGDGGLAKNAYLSVMKGMTIDASGNIYVSDFGNNRIRKVDTNGIIYTVAGGGNGGDGDFATGASLSDPEGIIIDAAGALYICDKGNNKVRKFNTNILPIIISSISPTSAMQGDTVTIKGQRFTGATSVYFGTNAAANYTILNDSIITAVVGNGASGSVIVKNTITQGLINGFNYYLPLPVPKILSFQPLVAPANGIVYIYGHNFLGTRSVSFGGVAAYIYSISESILKVQVFNGSGSTVKVVTDIGVDSLAGFTLYIPVPQIKSFSPVTAPIGTPITLLGKEFTKTTAVSFGGIAASSFNVVNDSTLIAFVGSGASGSISVTNKVGVGSISGFTLFQPQPPTINSFYPTMGPIGSLITITGTNLSFTTDISIGGQPVLVISTDSTKVVAMIMPGTVAGTIQITTKGGSVTTNTKFSIVASSYPQKQMGDKLRAKYNDIQGDGVALSADGNTALEARIGPFVRVNNRWVQEDTVLFKRVYPIAISADGNTACGVRDKIFVTYSRNNGVWSFQDSMLKFQERYSDVGDQTNVAMSGDGNTAVFGDPSDSGNIGGVWVFRRINNIWMQDGDKLVGKGCDKITDFYYAGVAQGYSVSISADGNTIIEGGYLNAYNRGAAWIFTKVNGAWIQQGDKLVDTTNAGHTAEQGFSASISADGNTAVIGGWDANSQTGAAWVYTRNSNVWSQQGAPLVGSDFVGGPAQGHSVAISADGNTIISGGPYDNNGLGAAWVFTRTAGVWTQRGNKLVGTGSIRGISDRVEQGYSLCISSDGNTALVGGRLDNPSGAVWTFVSGYVQPVTISSFTATSQNKAVYTNWQTSTELNTSHFIIQHSTDGNSFTDIGTVKAIGSGANGYQFTDNNPTNGTNYYRLKSVDKDGSFAYSKVVSCEWLMVSKQLVVYPNPAKSIVTISGSHIASIQVIDNIGRVVKVVSFKGTSNPSLSVSTLKAGVYHLLVQTTDGNVSGVGFVKE